MSALYQVRENSHSPSPKRPQETRTGGRLCSGDPFVLRSREVKRLPCPPPLPSMSQPQPPDANNSDLEPGPPPEYDPGTQRTSNINSTATALSPDVLNTYYRRQSIPSCCPAPGGRPTGRLQLFRWFWSPFHYVSRYGQRRGRNDGRKLER